MATKSSKKKGRSRPGIGQQLLDLLVRPEVAGVTLVLISVFTLLSLITNSRGQITGAWIDLLGDLFGVGVWLFPLVTAALGLWLVIHAIDRMDDIPWQRPVGFALIFFAAIMGATLYGRPEQADVGGATGRLLADTAETALGRWGAWAFVAFIAFCGIVFLADRFLAEGATGGWHLIQDWIWRYQEGRNQPQIHPELPLPSGRVPWWKRTLQRFTEPDDTIDAAPQLVRPEQPGRPNRTPTPTPSTKQPPQQNEPPRADLTPPSTDTELLKPRIVGGGGQEWRLPKPSSMLNDWDRRVDSDDLIREQGRLIQETLAMFGVPADFEGAYKGPSVTQYLIKPGYVERTIQGESKRMKVKVSKIASLSNDLALALAASSVRIEAPIPGTSYVGIEVPNRESNFVGLKELMLSETFSEKRGKLGIALGEDVKGHSIVTDLARMPHLLIAGATGTGKSICINSITACLMLTHTPDSLRFLMIDPKMVELSMYNGVPHLLSPVVTDVAKAAGVLFWAVKEMERRYQLASKANKRDLERYNAYLVERGETPLPYIVIIVDEMADLMMAAPEEVEKHICRLAQMARAVGIHMIIATQRPSVDVITGLIKANFPARIAFAVTSQIDSRVILDVPGAERLLGRGDMLFMAPDTSKLERLQGTFTDDEEIARVVRYWKGIRATDQPGAEGRAPASPQPQPASPQQESLPATPRSPAAPVVEIPTPFSGEQASLFEQIEELKTVDSRDDLFDHAVRVVETEGRGSISLLQRKLRIGYSRSSRLIEQLEDAGVLGPDRGSGRGREVLTAADDDFEDAPVAPPQGADDPIANDREPRIWM